MQYMDGGGVQPEAAVPVRKGPWTMEEDLVLVNYIAANGEGGWNKLARAAGLNRTGKSCRLRWLNYLRPDVRRGNITPEEHVLIVELQARWGNRWSKIARHLPGRTDNEVKNFWRTKIQKKHKNKSSSSTESIAAGCREAAAVAEDQGSSNSGRTGVTQDHGIVAQQPSICSLEHQGQGYAVHGGAATAAGAMDIPSEFLAASSDNFWALEDFWPTVQSLHGNC